MPRFHASHFLFLALSWIVLAITPCDAHTRRHHVPYFLAADHPTLHSIVRVYVPGGFGTPPMNLTIEAIDDDGNHYGPIETAIDRPADWGLEFTSEDLENGNADKNISGIGDGVGDWQLYITLPDGPLSVSAYISTESGFITAAHEVVPVYREHYGTHYRVPLFNFSDSPHQNRLRVINPDAHSVRLYIYGMSDKGTVQWYNKDIVLSPNEVRTFDAADLENLDTEPTGRKGRWSIELHAQAVHDETAAQPLIVMNLMEEDDTGIISNLSSLPDLKTVGNRSNETATKPDGCTDEHEQALEYTTHGGLVDDYSVPATWDGTPFQVMVSNALPNYAELVAAIADEAARIRDALGHEIIVAAGSARYEDISRSSLYHFQQGRRHVPPDGYIEIRCCDLRGAGTAYPWWRLILPPNLENDDAAFMGGHARINLIHELYHILGFVHSDEEGVTMSYPLDFALENPIDEDGNIVGDWYSHTFSTPQDLEKLGCIYD